MPKPKAAGQKKKGSSKKKGGSRKGKGKPKAPLVKEQVEKQRGKRVREEEAEDYTYVKGEDLDEEISEDGVFTAEDYKLYGDIGHGGSGKGDAAEASDGQEDVEEEPMEGDVTLMDMLDRDSGDDPEEQGSKKNSKRQKIISKGEDEMAGFLEGGSGSNDSDQGSDDDFAGATDEDNEDGESHAKMLQAVRAAAQLNTGKDGRAKKKLKTEKNLLLPESEFSAVRDVNPKGLTMAELLGNSDGLASSKVKKQLAKLRKDKKAKALPEPLEDVDQARLTRKLGYEKSKEHVSRWDAVVAKNREAETLQFPLQAAPRNVVSAAALQVNFTPSTSLEKDLDAILEQYGFNEEVLKKRESQQLEMRDVTPEEAASAKDKLAKMKNLLYYHELKLKRIKKIKSKTFRKLRKKNKSKNALSLEELEELDPEAAAAQREKQAGGAGEKQAAPVHVYVCTQVARIEERMSLQHKNTSSWAQRQLKYAKATGARGREDLTAANQLAQKLRKRPDGPEGVDPVFPSNAPQEEGASDDSSAIDSDDPEQVAARDARREERLARLHGELAETPASGVSKGVFAMKFMQRALDKKKANAVSEAAALDNELARAAKRAQQQEESSGSDGAGSGEGAGVEIHEDSANEEQTSAPQSGRRVFAGAAADQKAVSGGAGSGVKLQAGSMVAEKGSKGVMKVPRLLVAGADKAGAGVAGVATKQTSASLSLFEVEAFSSASESECEKESEQSEASKPAPSHAEVKAQRQRALQPAFNPARGASTKTNAAAVREEVVGTERLADEDAEPAQDDESANSESGEGEADPDASDACAQAVVGGAKVASANPWMAGAVNASGEAVGPLRKAARAGTDKATLKPVLLDPSAVLLAAPESDAFDVRGEQLQNAELVRRAFADGADTQAAFLKEKQAVVEETLPKMEPAGVPGWGSWGGAGVVVSARAKAHKERREKQILEKHTQKVSQIMSSRSDAKLDGVIITQKKDKKAVKFGVPALPHMFTSPAQFNAALATPLGPEWNTLTHFQSANKPRIITKPGEIIDPIKFNPQLYKRQQKKKAEQTRQKHNAKHGN